MTPVPPQIPQRSGRTNRPAFTAFARVILAIALVFRLEILSMQTRE